MKIVNRAAPQPLYAQVKEHLLRLIAGGSFRGEQPIPDERSLAEELGLSRMTVRRAILDLTREGLFHRVRGRGTFLASAAGRAPAAQLTTLAIVAPFGQAEVATSLFYYRILQGIQQATAQTGSSIVFRKVAAPYRDFAAALSQERNLSAMVVLGLVDQEILGALATVPLPLVLVDSSRPACATAGLTVGAPASSGARFDYVCHSGEESCFQAVTHLLQLGHRDVALLNYGPTPAARERQAGYERALAAQGLPIRREFIFSVECTSTAAYAELRRILNSGPVPTALFCTSDDLALGAMAAAKDHGLCIPRDLSVIGFGDLGHFTWPPLSTIRIPVEQMGLQAVEFLRRRVEQPGTPAQERVFPTEFLPRATCDCPRVERKLA